MLDCRFNKAGVSIGGDREDEEITKASRFLFFKKGNFYINIIVISRKISNLVTYFRLRLTFHASACVNNNQKKKQFRYRKDTDCNILKNIVYDIFLSVKI